MVKSQDRLQMYMGYDYILNEHIIIHQPTIGEIINLGEQKYWSVVYTICAIPSDMKSQLWDQGIDYEEISDFQLFIMLVKFAKFNSLILKPSYFHRSIGLFLHPINRGILFPFKRIPRTLSDWAVPFDIKYSIIQLYTLINT